MKIMATFVNFKYDAEAIELAHAWDEYCADSNPEGFEETRAQSIQSYGDDVLQVVHAEIEVPMRDIYARFESVVVAAEVSE